MVHCIMISVVFHAFLPYARFFTFSKRSHSKLHGVVVVAAATATAMTVHSTTTTTN